MARRTRGCLSMNLWKGYREVTVSWSMRKTNEGWEVDRTEIGKWGCDDEESEGEKIDGSRRSKGWGKKERGRGGERGRGSLRSSIGRFKDDHALSATHHTTLWTNQPPPMRTPSGSQTAWKQPLNFRAASLGWQRTSSFTVQFTRKRTDLGHMFKKSAGIRNHAYILREIANMIFLARNLIKKHHLAQYFAQEF